MGTNVYGRLLTQAVISEHKRAAYSAQLWKNLVRSWSRAPLIVHHLRYIGEQLLRVVQNAILDRPLHAADLLGLSRPVVQLQRARAIEDFQVLERVLIDDHEIGEHARTHRADLDGLCTRIGQCS